MSTVRAVGIALVALTIAFGAVSCGGGETTSGDGDVKLAGTPIPTAPVPTPTEVVCSPPQQLSLPENFPKEIPVPPDYVVWSVTTTPYLSVVGRSVPPVNVGRGEVGRGVVADSIIRLMNERGWKASINKHVDGQDYDETAPDGRVLHFNAIEKSECVGAVQLVYDLKWVTP